MTEHEEREQLEEAIACALEDGVCYEYLSLEHLLGSTSLAWRALFEEKFREQDRPPAGTPYMVIPVRTDIVPDGFVGVRPPDKRLPVCAVLIACDEERYRWGWENRRGFVAEMRHVAQNN